MRVRILLFLFCFFVTFTYGQTREYYKKEGVIYSRARSGGVNYNCRLFGNNMVILSDVNVKKVTTPKTPTRKPLAGGIGVNPTDPEIFHKIVGDILSRYSIKIFSFAEDMEQDERVKFALKNKISVDIERFDSIFGITVETDEKGQILNIKMRFDPHSNLGALPVEVYQEIETALRENLKMVVNDYGKASCKYFCFKSIYIKKPKDKL